MPEHPAAFYIQEEPLLEAIHTVIATRVFGAYRTDLLARQLAAAPNRATADHDAAIRAAEQRLHQIETRQTSLLAELDDTDHVTHAAWRARIRNRYTELAADYTEAQRHLDQLRTQAPKPTGEPDLLNQLPPDGRRAPPTSHRHPPPDLRRAPARSPPHEQDPRHHPHHPDQRHRRTTTRPNGGSCPAGGRRDD
ncbi:hypothetical protein [Cryptosporangium minutisporangium]|uniref:Uncharacterized protein n=1 Tax=Cryptosporangium minutisporangium TaxID=113569 RepID=A0ABP6TBG2_9ACTN